MTENPFKPKKESETPKPKPAAKPDAPRVHRYRWPSDHEGKGEFNRVDPDSDRGRKVGDFMRT